MNRNEDTSNAEDGNKKQGEGKADTTELEDDSLPGQNSTSSPPRVQSVNSTSSAGASSESGDRDALVKRAAASQLGAVTVGRASSLEQLERDVASKQYNRPIAAASKPGAVSVNSSSSLERGLNDKQPGFNRASQPGAVSVSASNSLERLERDVNAKQAGTGDRSTLQALEQDMAAKRQAGTNVASQPGAVSVSASNSLEQLERDVNAKQAGTVGRSTLQALEQDMAAKRQAGANVASQPGAVSVSASNSLEQLERDVNAKQAGIGGRSTLQALEQDIVAKRKAGTSSASQPGAISVSASTSLEQLEQDLLRKQMSGGVNKRPGTNLEQEILAKSQSLNKSAFKPGAVQLQGASSMLTDLINKTQSGVTSRTQENHRKLGTANDAPLQVQSSDRAQCPQDFKDHIGDQMGTECPLEAPTIFEERGSKLEISYGEYAPEPDHIGLDSPPPPISEEISGPLPRIDHRDSATNDPDPEQPPLANQGVPFFAETVVDATGVAVISGKDEVNEEWERRSMKKLVCYGVTLVMVVVAAVVVAVLLSESGDNASVVTEPPTLAPTAAPTSADFPLLLQRLTAVSDTELLRNPESIQHRAARWIALADNYNIPQESEAKLLQRYILVVFYYAMRGDSWGQCSSVTTCYANEQSWLSGTDECSWAAVGCNENGVVEELNFDKAEKEYDQAFYGPEFVFSMNYRLPDEIGKLSELKLFHLHTNYKTRGTLAAFSNLAKLESLFLDYNKFSGDIPESFADDHPNLAYLSVAYNELKGSLPTSLARLNNLSTLIVGGNQLSGEIPSEFGIATNLELFDLQYNNFVGSIPASFYNPNLRELRLGGNDIVGSISGNISLMTELRALSLENSAMSGKLPTEIYFLPKLKELRLSNANFEGELSEDFRWLNATLMELGLGGNNFFGEIPQAFDDLKILEKLNLGSSPLLTGSISAALCSKRGTGFGRLSELVVDCHIECGCCGKRQCP